MTITPAPQPTSGRHSRPEPVVPMQVRPTASPERPARPGRVYPPAPVDVTDRILIPPQSQRQVPSQVPGQVAGRVPGRPPQAPFGPGPTGLAMTRRHPVAAWLGLPLITFGIYSYVWYYKIHREMAEFDRRRTVPVAGPMLVLLLLPWTLVAPLVSFHNTGRRIANAQRAAGLQPTCNPWIGLLLCFCFGLQVLYYQAELNKVVDAYRVAPGTQVALRA